MGERDQSVTKPFDKWSTVVMALTLLFFTMALFKVGLAHDLLLEAGVFLVSLKLILMTYKNWVLGETLKERLDRIQESIYQLRNSSDK